LGFVHHGWLVLGRVTVFRWAFYVTSYQTNSASYPQQNGKWVPAKCGDALWLGSKGRMAHSICGCMCG